ncbi:caspase family protein [Bradyrhizobium sp. UFLA05-109]
MKRVCLLLFVFGMLSGVFVGPISADSVLAGIAVPSPVVKAPSLNVLSVGISKYNYLARLRTPTSDAQLLVSTLAMMNDRLTLKSAKTITDGEATKDQIIQEYRALIQQTDTDDLAIFFFSGHATQDPSKSRVYLIPAEFRQEPNELAARGLDLQRDIIATTPPEKKVLIIIDGCSVGDGNLGPLMDQHPQLVILASSKADELSFESASFASTAFVGALVDVLKNPNSDLDGDRQLSVEELYVQLYPKMVGTDIGFYGQQHPSMIGLRSHRLMLATSGAVEPPNPKRRLDLAADHLNIPDLASISKDVISINGTPLEQQDQYNVFDDKISFLGSGTDLVRKGLNLLTIGRQQYYLWRVGESLKAFKNPYQNSRAIIVAIDDYERRKDPLKRGPTPFPALSGMVKNAESLKAALISLGFPSEGIIELYDERASLENLEKALESFWIGGSNAAADRLFIYFGGHGENFQRNNLLVTYDYDERQKLMTTFQAKDLVERHSRNIQANHVLFAIDVCYSGLVFLGDEDDNERQLNDEIQRLAVIERNVSDKARNVITAGFGDQRAITENGGIFTKALVEGLGGKADPANTGVIQFDQLGIFVKDQVTRVARMQGFRQTPTYNNLKEFGDGRMMFIRSSK